MPIHRFSYPVIKLWDYIEQIRSGQLRPLAPLLVMLEQEPTEETLQVERQLILAEPDPAKRADLLAIAVTLAARHFDQEFLRRFFREELAQMQHATLIDEWLDEAVEKAVKEVELRAIAQGKQAGIKERAMASIVRILTSRFAISALQEEMIRMKLSQITQTDLLDLAEERALQSFNFVDFSFYLDELLVTQANTGSGQ